MCETNGVCLCQGWDFYHGDDDDGPWRQIIRDFFFSFFWKFLVSFLFKCLSFITAGSDVSLSLWKEGLTRGFETLLSFFVWMDGFFYTFSLRGKLGLTTCLLAYLQVVTPFWVSLT